MKEHSILITIGGKGKHKHNFFDNDNNKMEKKKSPDRQSIYDENQGVEGRLFSILNIRSSNKEEIKRHYHYNDVVLLVYIHT